MLSISSEQLPSLMVSLVIVRHDSINHEPVHKMCHEDVLLHTNVFSMLVVFCSVYIDNVLFYGACMYTSFITEEYREKMNLRRSMEIVYIVCIQMYLMQKNVKQQQQTSQLNMMVLSTLCSTVLPISAVKASTVPRDMYAMPMGGQIISTRPQLPSALTQQPKLAS